MKTYIIEFKEYMNGDVCEVKVNAKNKEAAYDKALNEIFTETIPYSFWVAGYIKKSGGFCRFNTFEGNPL